MKKRVVSLVTVCVQGSKAKQHRTNDSRFELAGWVLDRIESEGWDGLDAVVFPGGFFRSDRPVGHLVHDKRVNELGRAGLAGRVSKLLRKLPSSPDALLVGGIDGPSLATEGGDQLCVAWDGGGIAGIGRKVFPTFKKDKEKKGSFPEADWFVSQAQDYSEEHRVVALPSGPTAVLCACYDVFGVAERNGRMGRQAKGIKRVFDAGMEYRRDGYANEWTRLSDFRGERDKCLRGWSDLLASTRVSVGIGAIHGFEGHSTAYWQKHGIASCSAALNGGLAVGAAHFAGGLPKDASRSSLAARNVAHRHLTQGVNRQTHGLLPTGHFRIEGDRALVRLYEG